MKKFDNKIDNNFSTPICLSCYHLWVFLGFFLLFWNKNLISSWDLLPYYSKIYSPLS